MSAPKTLHPEIMYAERSSADDAEKNIIYFTINVPDIQGEPKLEITADHVKFAATSGDASKGLPVKSWECDVHLWGEINPDATKKLTTSRAILLILQKKELNSEYWPRLTKEKPNRNWIKTDFARWADEDEQEGAEVEMPEGMDAMGGGGMPGLPGGGMGGMEQMMAGMGGGMGGGMPGMPGMGGMGGGAGGMDFAKLMEQMGGMGGAGMPGMPDLSGLDGDDEGEDVAEAKAGEPEIEEVE